MAGPNNNTFQLMWMLGLALTLPMILLCGPLAGYFFGYALVKKLHLPGYLMPVLIVIGLLASAAQTVALIRKLMTVLKNQNPKPKT